jgi:hypothetical protein
VTRAAEKRLEAEDELLTPDAHAAAAASLRSRGAAAEPRAAAHRAQQQHDDTWQAADELVRNFLVAILYVHTRNITVIHQLVWSHHAAACPRAWIACLSCVWSEP